jgi:hypothetical protein
MKRILFLGLVFCVLTACKKEYACEYPNGEDLTYSDKDYSDSQIEAAKNTCDMAGGSWSEK